ncbi:transglycosylase SLT domain-containing protein [Nitrosomonas sp. ANs5]|uniref:transglycosylase SLT domain-containing protein n=1 Tax=Nitrosomonas sp. ANs5 TaxID=3423941 RepID=UPI003D3374B2
MKKTNNTLLALIAAAVLPFFSTTAEADKTLENNKKNIAVLETRQISALPRQQHNDLWARVRAGFALASMQSQEVRFHEKDFSKRQQFIDRIVERSRRYLYYIIEEVERRNMPTEIALLPIVESAYDPDAYSHRHAAGLWQFIPSTAKAFGLEQNWWHDERRDVVAATRAALDYLQQLHNMFGNWKLALAAYNWGQGSLKKVIDEEHGGRKSVKFQDLRLPSETRHHVAKLIAIRNIVANPGRYGVKLKPIPDRPYFEQIELTQQIDVRLVARLAGISENEFNALNPAHHRPVIQVKDAPRTLLLPVTQVRAFVSNLENYDKVLVSWRVYRAKQAETVQDLSNRYRIAAAKLAEINGISERDALKKGQILLVPRDGSSIRERTYLAHNIPTETKKPRFEQLVYTVRKGDTLYDIAKRYGIDIQSLKSWNDVSDRLSVGQELTLRLFSL